MPLVLPVLKPAPLLLLLRLLATLLLQAPRCCPRPRLHRCRRCPVCDGSQSVKAKRAHATLHRCMCACMSRLIHKRHQRPARPGRRTCNPAAAQADCCCRRRRLRPLPPDPLHAAAQPCRACNLPTELARASPVARPCGLALPQAAGAAGACLRPGRRGHGRGARWCTEMLLQRRDQSGALMLGGLATPSAAHHHPNSNTSQVAPSGVCVKEGRVRPPSLDPDGCHGESEGEKRRCPRHAKGAPGSLGGTPLCTRSHTAGAPPPAPRHQRRKGLGKANPHYRSSSCGAAGSLAAPAPLPGVMNEEYDAIVLGTGLKECIISGLLSVDKLKASRRACGAGCGLPRPRPQRVTGSGLCAWAPPQLQRRPSFPLCCVTAAWRPDPMTAWCRSCTSTATTTMAACQHRSACRRCATGRGGRMRAALGGRQACLA